MKLDDFKNNWKQLDELSTKSNINESEIQALVEKRDKKNRIKALMPELAMVLLYAYLIVFLTIFNYQFSSSFEKTLSWIAISTLLCQIGLIYFTARTFYKHMILHKSYSQTIDHLRIECEKLNKRYYLIIGLNLVILISCIILLPKIYSENPSFNQSLTAILIGVIILGLVSLKIYRYYKILILRNNYLMRKLKK